jgi:hypothetical protein
MAAKVMEFIIKSQEEYASRLKPLRSAVAEKPMITPDQGQSPIKRSPFNQLDLNQQDISLPRKEVTHKYHSSPKAVAKHPSPKRKTSTVGENMEVVGSGQYVRMGM